MRMRDMLKLRGLRTTPQERAGRRVTEIRAVDRDRESRYTHSQGSALSQESRWKGEVDAAGPEMIIPGMLGLSGLMTQLLRVPNLHAIVAFIHWDMP
eukprot:15447659-Alexandrium_andersonii.AAC.1